MLLACNLTSSPVTLAAGKRTVVLPAKVGSLTYGAPVDVSSELAGLAGGDYTALQAQVSGGSVAYFWTNVPLFAVGTLTVGTNVNGVTVQNTAATITPMVMSRSVTYVAPNAADLVSVVAAVLPANGVLTIVAQPDYPRKLQVRVVTGSTAGTLTLVGVGKDGEAVTQAIDISATGGSRTVKTDKAFATLTSATVSAISGAAGTVGIGLGTALALPSNKTPAGASFSCYKACVDGADEAVGTVDATAGTIEPTTAPDNSKNYQFFYTFSVTPVSPAHTHTLA